MTIYSYITLPVSVAHWVSVAPDKSKPDSYISEEPGMDEFRQALRDGYRWIRTDGDFAILEKPTNPITGCLQSKTRH